MASRKSTRGRRRPAGPKRVRAARTRAAAPRRAKASSRRAPAPRRATVARSGARTSPTPNAIGLVRHHMDYTSHDLAAVERFYATLLGFSGTDTVGGYLTVHTSPTSSLGFMPPMPVAPEQWRPPREPALYFMVEDVDRAHRELTKRGVAFEMAPMDAPWGHRFAALLDPEGRRVCLAHPLGKRASSRPPSRPKTAER